MSIELALTIILGVTGILYSGMVWMIKAKIKSHEKEHDALWEKLNGHTEKIEEVKLGYATTVGVEKYVDLKNAALIDRLERIMSDIKAINRKLG